MLKCLGILLGNLERYLVVRLSALSKLIAVYDANDITDSQPSKDYRKHYFIAAYSENLESLLKVSCHYYFLALQITIFLIYIYVRICINIFQIIFAINFAFEKNILHYPVLCITQKLVNHFIRRFDSRNWYRKVHGLF